MLRHVVVFSAFFVLITAEQFLEKPGPKYPPTKGEVWPKPQQESKQNIFYTLNPQHFNVKVKDHTCAILTNAIERYVHTMRRRNGVARRNKRRSLGKRHSVLLCSPCVEEQDDKYKGELRELDISLTSPCEEYPYFEMDESYNLTVAETSVLKSDSIWGIVRGLETLAQLFYMTDDFTEVRINATHIVDYPRYAHRGVLLDTSRHYISVNNILLMLDAMAMNKMNVFHWHIVDDQSFPYQSKKFPDLSNGAYHPTMVYTKSDIKHIIEYARDRGVRVVPEFDVPGHTRSWGVAYPDVLTKCYSYNEVIGLGPMNPINNITYKLLRDLFQEVQTWFPDRYFHIGGDEVDMSCWGSNPEILEYMSNNNMSSLSELHALFMRNTIPLLASNSQPIVWQEVFDEGVPLSKDTLVQVWKNGWENEMTRVILAGHRVLFSSSWYLDHLKSGGDWENYYSADPRHMVNSSLAENIVGGEACMWGEVVDDRNIMNRVWPRASAVAEKLWSPEVVSYKNQKDNLNKARNRLEEHTCRMIRRGIAAQPPNGPGFCVIA